MAISANAVWEIQTGGNDNNGGGFIAGAAGTDYSQVATNRVATGTDDSTTDVVATGNTTLTSAGANFQSSIVGNVIYLQGGSGSLVAGWYQVLTRISATQITVDRVVAAGTGITMNIGGAFASLGGAGRPGFVGGMQYWMKSGTYTVTSATPNISGGCFQPAGQFFLLQGYQTTRGDLGTPPLLQASGISAFTFISSTASDSAIVNINLDGAGLTSSRGVTFRGSGYRLNGVNFTNTAFNVSTDGILVRCSATGCTTQPAIIGFSCIDCVVYNCTVTGFKAGSSANVFVRCIADTCTGATSDGFDSVAESTIIANCVAYACGRHGFNVSNGDNSYIQNCISEDNDGWGYLINNRVSVHIINCAGFSNALGEVSLGTGKFCFNHNYITGSGSFFTNAAGQDFNLNNTSGAGAAARAAGYPGVLLVGGTGYLDLGALQHQDTGGGGGASEHSSVFLG